MQNDLESSIVNIFDSFVVEYMKERKTHLHNWLNLKMGFGRIFNRKKTFDHLRKKDFELTKSFETKLKKIIIDENLSKSNLINMKTFLKNHRLILNFRVMFLSLFLTTGVALYAFFKKITLEPPIDCRGIIVISALLIFGLGLFYERWNIKQKDAIYQEIENLIQGEVDQIS